MSSRSELPGKLTLGLEGVIRPRASQEPAPLTDRQMTWWRETGRNGRAKNKRMRAAAVRILGCLDVSILRSGIEFVVGRHESLRTRIAVRDGVLLQQVEESTKPHFDVVDLAGVSENRADQGALTSAIQFFDQEVDLSVGPLFSQRLLRISDQSHVLLLGIEHMVADGMSCEILNREIWTVYSQLYQGRSPALQTLPIQLSDYADWLQKTHQLRSELFGPYWRSRMFETPTIQIPLISDTSRSEGGQSEFNIPLGKSLTAALRLVGQQQRTLLPIVILAIYVVSMSRWCNQRDVVVLLASHGRHNRPELRSMIGYLASPLYLRIIVDESETLPEFLTRVGAEFFAVINHQPYSIPLPAECNPSLCFNWGGMFTYSARWSIDQRNLAVPGLRVQPFNLPDNTNVTFYPNFSDTPSGVVMTVRYRTSRVSRTALEKLARNMRFLANELAMKSSVPIASLPVLE